MTDDQDLTFALTGYPTSVVSDALDELGIDGVLIDIAPRREGQGRICGRALPVRFLSMKDDPGAYRFGGGVGKPLEQVLKTMRGGDVVVMDLGGARNAAAWGGLASRLAQLRGVRGTVLWGCCRDVEEIRAIGYPVWSSGVSPRRSRNDFTFGSINEPVTIGSVLIASGDYIIADESGVICVPHRHALEIMKLCARIAQQETTLEAQVIGNAILSWDAI